MDYLGVLSLCGFSTEGITESPAVHRVTSRINVACALDRKKANPDLTPSPLSRTCRRRCGAFRETAGHPRGPQDQPLLTRAVQTPATLPVANSHLG